MGSCVASSCIFSYFMKENATFEKRNNLRISVLCKGREKEEVLEKKGKTMNLTLYPFVIEVETVCVSILSVNSVVSLAIILMLNKPYKNIPVFLFCYIAYSRNIIYLFLIIILFPSIEYVCIACKLIKANSSFLI